MTPICSRRATCVDRSARCRSRQRVSLSLAAGRAPRADRPQRRRQDHPRQPADRRAATHERQRADRRRRRDAPAGRAACPSRPVAHVPDQHAVCAPDAARSGGRRDPRTRADRHRLRRALAARRVAAAGRSSTRRRHCSTRSVSRATAMCRPTRSPTAVNASSRSRSRSAREAARAAARRAGRGHPRRRERRAVRGARRVAGRRGDPADRARHDARVPLRDDHHGAGRRPRNW